jgi:hypothetical protein
MYSNDTFKGICQGVIADGELNESEATFLLEYLSNAPDIFLTQYPANILTKRLIASLKDGVLDDDELSDLLGILLEVVYGPALPSQKSEQNHTVDLKWHFDDCSIEFENKNFVITGTFKSASRSDLERLITSRGGFVNKKNVTRSTDYVLVGELTSAGWKNGNYGNKINSALNLRDQSKSLKIISEKHWLELLKLNSDGVFNLLHGLWPSPNLESKTIKRGTELIAGYLDENNKFSNDHWGFNVGYCFRDSLDIRLDTRLKDKKPYSVWTQGAIIKFKEGDLIFSKCKTYALSVTFGNRMGWDDDTNSMFEGSVNFMVARMHDEKRFIKYLGQTTMTQMEFLKLLIDGPLILDNINYRELDSAFLAMIESNQETP